jgi:hypothetical protein
MTMPNASNLFLINHDEIRRLLAEANASLLRRRDTIIAEFHQVPDQLKTDKEFENAQAVIEKLHNVGDEARRERLKDQSPFKEAVKTVQEFYSDIEKPLRSTLQTILERLTDAVRNAANPETPAIPIGVGIDGEPIVVTPSPSPVLGPKITLAWSVESIDRKNLDLEKLRDYLTDACLAAACRRHLAEQGPNTVRGVKYQQVAQPT